MSQYVIRNSNGRYVSLPGRENTFTNKLVHAQRFETFEHAKSQCCGNEHPERLTFDQWRELL